MHIEHLYFSTYSQSVPISGHMDVRLGSEKAMVRVEFNDTEAAQVQAIAVRAFERAAEQLAEQITTESPRLLEISAQSEEA